MNSNGEKYRRDSHRASWWDYSDAAAYFITICTKNMQHFFGSIDSDLLQVNHRLSEIGEIAQNEWIKTPEIRSDMNLFLGEFVVMPNHFHAIICIGSNQYNINSSRDTMPRVENRKSASNLGNVAKHRDGTGHQKRFGAQSKNLASIIRGYKSSVTMKARQLNPAFAWQANYYDRIIRNEYEYVRIAEYIQNNPKNWGKDKFR